jgi:L-histidine Nalpha-methyltransferase
MLAQMFTELVEADPAFRRDVLSGLSAPSRAIPARWFYDRAGSELFESITVLPEYYVARTEQALLSNVVAEIAELVGGERALVEFGSGSSTKTRTLLSVINPGAYVPIDISREFLCEAVSGLSADFKLPIYPIEGDFEETLKLPAAVRRMSRLGFFPGSTIGNLSVPDAVDMLRSIAATLGPNSMLLIGIDRVKDLSVLLPAYDDAEGITAAFNLNLLHRINRELDGTVPVDAFHHVARWNACESRIEMLLEADRDIHFMVGGRMFSMAEGETIHTENSHKYGLREASTLLRAGGWTPIRHWTDPDEFFSLFLATHRSGSGSV